MTRSRTASRASSAACSSHASAGPSPEKKKKKRGRPAKRDNSKTKKNRTREDMQQVVSKLAKTGWKDMDPMTRAWMRALKEKERAAKREAAVTIDSDDDDDVVEVMCGPSKQRKRDVKTEVESETGSAPTTPNRRKQQFNASIDEEANSDLRMISDGSNRAAPQPEDLAMVPVFLSEGQRDQFFSPLIPVDPAVPDGSQRCSKCNDVSKSIKEGRRHMVTHIRVIRLRCRLCGVGSFFCTDLRTHLIDGFCKGLVNVPEPMPKGQGDDKAQILWADRMCCLVDPNHQGRVVYTQGMIVSAANFNAHLPDPVIEESILGKSIQDMAASNKMQHL